MPVMISSLVPGLLLRVRKLREAIANGGTERRTVADLQVELDIKQDLLKQLLDKAVVVKANRKAKVK